MKRYLLFLLANVMVLASAAQTAATNTGTLYISGGGDVFYAASDFTNNSGSSLTNNGSLYVKGNLSNSQSSMTAGTGTLYLNGTSAQTLSGSQPFKTYHLNTNNSAGITLNNDLSVSGTHTFAAGVIATSATPNYLIYESGSSYSGDGDTRHVNGWVKKIGSTNFTFPVGDGSVERTVALSSLSASSEFNVKYSATTPNSYTMVTPVWDVNEPEYWTINRVSGGTAVVTLNWNYSKVYFPNWVVSDILVTGYNGSAWTDFGGAGTASGTASTTGTVSSSATSSFNLFTFGSRTYVLAMSLTGFTAARNSGSTQLAWTSENDNGVASYQVQRSDDGAAFTTFATIASQQRTGKASYTSTDIRPISGEAYYRLVWQELSGKTQYSRIITLREGSTAPMLTLLSNPVKNRIQLSASGTRAGSYRYWISNAGGQAIQQGFIQVQGDGIYTIPVTALRGYYFLNLSLGSENYRFKVLVE